MIAADANIVGLTAVLKQQYGQSEHKDPVWFVGTYAQVSTAMGLQALERRREDYGGRPARSVQQIADRLGVRTVKGYGYRRSAFRPLVGYENPPTDVTMDFDVWAVRRGKHGNGW